MEQPTDAAAVDTPVVQGPPRVRPPAWLAGVAGAVSVGLALGLTELLAGLIADAPSAVSSIGAIIVDNSPPAVEDFAIGLFGTNDKLALAVGTVVVALAVGYVLGGRALDAFAAAVQGFVAFGLLGIVAVALDPIGDAVLGGFVVVVGVGVGLVVLRSLLDQAERVASAEAITGQGDVGRRRLLAAMAGTAVTALVAGSFGRTRLTSGGGADTTDLVLPEPTPGTTPPGTEQAFAVDGLTPVVVPNDEFYRIDTALVVPRVDPDGWSVRVHGLVDRELTLTLDELYAMEQVERYVTIACVSNEIGDDLVGNAAWQGVRLAPLLEQAGVSPDAGQVVGRSVDGWTAGFPTELVFDGRDPIIALGMNGEPLPADHGYPARLIVPGLYGYVSATKWLSEIELTTWDGFDAYWVPRGWAKQAPIKLQSRIDVPRQGARLEAGRVVAAGVAWSGLDGISAVELAVDDGPWQPADVTQPLSDASWVQWRVELDVEPGNRRLEVRATDASGTVQTDERSGPRPDGATGHHSVTVRVA